MPRRGCDRPRAPRDVGGAVAAAFAARYDRRSGIGTATALMLPDFLAMSVVWTAFVMLWYLIGLPWGI